MVVPFPDRSGGKGPAIAEAVELDRVRGVQSLLSRVPVPGSIPTDPTNEMADKKSAKNAGGGGQARGGLAQRVQPDAQLAAVVGSDPLPRSEMTKKIWDYIKSNDLQDPDNRRMINADDKLRPIFGKDQVSMFEMTRLVNQHVE